MKKELYEMCNTLRVYAVELYYKQDAATTEVPAIMSLVDELTLVCATALDILDPDMVSNELISSEKAKEYRLAFHTHTQIMIEKFMNGNVPVAEINKYIQNALVAISLLAQQLLNESTSPLEKAKIFGFCNKIESLILLHKYQVIIIEQE